VSFGAAESLHRSASRVYAQSCAGHLSGARCSASWPASVRSNSSSECKMTRSLSASDAFSGRIQQPARRMLIWRSCLRVRSYTAHKDAALCLWPHRSIHLQAIASSVCHCTAGHEPLGASVSLRLCVRRPGQAARGPLHHRRRGIPAVAAAPAVRRGELQDVQRHQPG